MPEKGDINFTFDASGFKAAMTEMSNGLAQLTKNTEGMTGKMSTGVMTGMIKFSVLAAVAKKGFGMLAGAVKTWIPEIGTAFDIAGKIISKNLLWPLRKELLPLIQKMLSWVRDNRKVFVQLGGVIVNVFRMVKTIFTSLLKLFDPIIQNIKNVLKSIFGDTVKSLADTVNMIIAKITIFIMALQIMLQPIFDALGTIIGALIKAVSEFVKGYVIGFQKVFDMGKGIGGVATILTDLKDILVKLTPAFKVLGGIMGVFVGTVLKQLITSLKLVVDLFTNLFALVMGEKNLKESLKSMGVAFKDFAVDGAKSLITGAKVAVSKNIWSKAVEEPPVKDAIITKTGKVIRTSPEDNIFAGKGMPGGKTEVNLNFPGMVLQVTEGNARQAGENFVGGTESGIRRILLDNLLLQGAH